MNQNELQHIVAEMRETAFHPDRSALEEMIWNWASRIEAAQAVAPGGRVGKPFDLILRDLCELDPADPDSPDTVRVHISDLTRILLRHIAAAPASEAKGHEVIEMRLCEAPHLILKRDQLYRFTVDPNCAQCREAAMAYEPAASCAAEESGLSLVEKEPPAESCSHDWVTMAHKQQFDYCTRCGISRVAAEQGQAGELPELPEPQAEVSVAGYNDGLLRPALEDYYTAEQMHAYARTALLRRAARVEVTDAARSWHKAFKNFHRSLCKRFGYCHDEID